MISEMLRDPEVTRGALFVNAAAAAFMTGLIWFVQVVHYPLMARVVGSGGEGWREQLRAYCGEHQRRTTLVVAAPMLIEAVAACVVVASLSGTEHVAWASALVLAGVWLSTCAVQVPIHGALERADDAARATRLVRLLVRTNWVRTIGWSARAVLGVWMAYAPGGAS